MESRMESFMKSVSEIDIENLNYGHPTKHNTNKNIHVSPFIVDGKMNSMVIQTPKIELGEIRDGYAEFTLKELKSSSSKLFYSFVKNLETKSMQTVYDNSEKWFNKKIPAQVIRDMHKPILMTPDQPNGNIKMYLKLSNKMAITVGEDSVDMDYLLLNKDSHNIKCMIRLDGIVFGRNAFKLDIKVVQIGISKKESKKSTKKENVDNYNEYEDMNCEDYFTEVVENSGDSMEETCDLQNEPVDDVVENTEETVELQESDKTQDEAFGEFLGAAEETNVPMDEETEVVEESEELVTNEDIELEIENVRRLREEELKAEISEINVKIHDAYMSNRGDDEETLDLMDTLRNLRTDLKNLRTSKSI